MDKKDKASILGMIFICVCVFMMMITLLFLGTKNQELEKKLEFDYIREGKCTYVETDGNYQGCIYHYCLVYDEETDKTIKVTIPEELNPSSLYVGDTVVYVIDYNYTNAKFLNRVRKL